MSKMFIFPTPLNAHCELTPDDTGETYTASPDTHPSGRPGQSWEIPGDVIQEHGAQRVITAPKKNRDIQRGIMLKRPDGLWYFLSDDVHLSDEKECPPPTPTPIPPTPDKTPLGIIKAVYATGLYNLRTKEGCGKFTEACCTALHTQLDQSYGHLRKVAPQNQYNGHAVDALQRLTPQADSGIFDIITASESLDARPAYNKAGDADPSKWYYPA